MNVALVSLGVIGALGFAYAMRHTERYALWLQRSLENKHSSPQTMRGPADKVRLDPEDVRAHRWLFGLGVLVGLACIVAGVVQ